MKKCEATIGTYLGICETDSGVCYQVNPKTKREIEGYVFGSYIYDFKENRRYYIIQRGTNGFLENSQFGKIKSDVEYALEVREHIKTKQTERNKVKSIIGPTKR